MAAPIPCLAGIGEVAATDLASNTQEIEPGRLRRETRLDIPQALPAGQLREGHAQELVEAAKGVHAEVAAIPGHHSVKRMPWRKLHEFSEHGLADMHAPPDKSGKPVVSGAGRSNRLYSQTS